MGRLSKFSIIFFYTFLDKKQPPIHNDATKIFDRGYKKVFAEILLLFAVYQEIIPAKTLSDFLEILVVLVY